MNQGKSAVGEGWFTPLWRLRLVGSPLRILTHFQSVDEGVLAKAQKAPLSLVEQSLLLLADVKGLKKLELKSVTYSIHQSCFSIISSQHTVDGYHRCIAGGPTHTLTS